MSITYEQLMDAARKADAAGDATGARRLLELALEAKGNTQSPMQERIAAAKAGTLQMQPGSAERAAAADKQAETAMQNPGKLGAFVFGGAQGATLGFADEIVSTAASPVNGSTYDDNLASVRATDRAAQESHPWIYGAGNVIGGIAGAIGALALAPEGLAAAGGGTITSRAAQSALGGSVAGGVYGFGSGEGGFENRAKSAALGAATGAAAGGAASLVGSGAQTLLQRLKGRDISVIASSFKISPDAAKVVKAAIENDDFAAAQAAIQRAGDDAMLADASPAATQLLDTAMQSGGKAARIGRDAVEARASAANDRLTRMFDGLLGTPTGTKAANSEIATRTAGIRQQAYDRAYGSVIDYASDTGRNIEAVLSRIPPRTVQAAVSEANDAMRAAGIKNQQIMAEIADDGSVVFREMPNVQQLDELKKALGAIAQNETDAVTGRITGAGVRAKNLARELSDAIGGAVPSYKTAVKLGGDKIAEQNALDLGGRLLLPSVTRETVADAMKGASKEAIEAAKRGLRTYIDDTLANVKSAVSNPNIDAAEALRAVRDLSSRANREKVAMVLGDSRANALFKALDEARAQLETRANVARNSATASRTAGKQAMDAITARPGMEALASGSPVKAGVGGIVRMLTGITPEANIARQQQIYAEIAQALTSIKGPEAQAALRVVQKAIAGQPATDAEAALVGRALTVTGALTGLAAGRNLLASPIGATP